MDCLDDLLLRNNPRVEVAEGIRALRALHTTANVDAARHPAALPFSRHLPGGGTENRGGDGTAICPSVDRHGDRGSRRPAKIEQAGYPTLERATRARQWGWFYRGNDTVWLADFVPPSFIGEFGSTDR